MYRQISMYLEAMSRLKEERIMKRTSYKWWMAMCNWIPTKYSFVMSQNTQSFFTATVCSAFSKRWARIIFSATFFLLTTTASLPVLVRHPSIARSFPSKLFSRRFIFIGYSFGGSSNLHARARIGFKHSGELFGTNKIGASIREEISTAFLLSGI